MVVVEFVRDVAREGEGGVRAADVVGCALLVPVSFGVSLAGRLLRVGWSSVERVILVVLPAR